MVPLPPVEEAVGGAVAVEVLAEARQARQRVPEFLVVFHARGVGPILQLGVDGGVEHFGQALVELVELVLEGDLAGGQGGELRRRCAQARGDAAELARGERGLRAVRSTGRRRWPSAGTSSTPGTMSSEKVLIDGRGGVQFGEAALSALRSALGSSATAVRRLDACAAKGCEEAVLKLTEQFPELLLVHVELGGDFFDAGEQLREIVRFRARERLVDDRAVAQRFGAAVVGLVERLGHV